MERVYKKEFSVEDPVLFKRRLHRYLEKQAYYFWLNSNQSQRDIYAQYDLLVGWNPEEILLCKTEKGAFDQLRDFCKRFKRSWKFGLLAYDLKNDVEELHSNNAVTVDFPPMAFIATKNLISMKGDLVFIEGTDLDSVEDLILDIKKEDSFDFKSFPKVNIQSDTRRDEYLEKVRKIKNHIVEGDIYEMNYCIEFHATNTSLDPIQTYETLNKKSKAPFSAFVKWKDKYLLSASPERFLRKRGSTLISQPIKGTAARSKDKEEDSRLKKALHESEKDRAENVMIVDLVRNDLAMVSDPGSVEVPELFKIYSFKTVHQMISTVKSTLRKDIFLSDALRSCFPMGSMTGAPKHRSMQLIEHYENSKRGMYSGSIGYIKPDGDFDFNVVIRSILYDDVRKKLSFQVGGAIVYDSSPEGEYQECLLKAKAIFETLGAAMPEEK